MVIKFCILLFAFLICVYASATPFAIFNTHNQEIPIILFRYPEGIDADANIFSQVLTDYNEAGNYSRRDLEGLLNRLMIRFPGSSFIDDPRAMASFIPADQVESLLAASIHLASNTSHEDPDARHPRDLEDWKRFSTAPNVVSLPVKVRRSFIVEDAVLSYKELDHIPKLIPIHLFNRNIKVKFADEAGEDHGGLRNDFFTLFFLKAIENSGLFALNSEGYVIVAPGRTYLEDLDTYEAFGFYLAKAFQNNVPVGCQFAKIIIEMIKYGQLSFDSLDLLASWDPELTSGLKSFVNLSQADLFFFNFKDINPLYPSIRVTRDNAALYNVIKMQNEINSNYRVQLVMIALGFSRACPSYLLAKSNIDLSAAFIGNKSLTAEALIQAFVVEGPRSAIVSYASFSKWLRSLNPSQLMKFFRFVTGMKVTPPGNLSKQNLKIAFLTSGTEHLLPQANTCRRTLILPPYRTEEQALEQFNKLLRNIESGEAFGFGFA